MTSAPPQLVAGAPPTVDGDGRWIGALIAIADQRFTEFLRVNVRIIHAAVLIGSSLRDEQPGSVGPDIDGGEFQCLQLVNNKYQ